MEPVIYCVVACLALLDGVAHQPLLRLPDATVLALGGSAFTALRARDPAIPVLYFAPADYAAAIDGLAPGEVEAAIAWRVGNWSSRALDRAPGWLFRQGSETLSDAAAAWRGAAGTTAAPAALAGHFAELVDLLAQMNGQGRFDGISFDELLIFALEKEALLLAEIAALPDPARLRAEAAERAETARVLGDALRRRGRTEYGGPPPYMELWRGAAVAPADAALAAMLKTRWEPAVPWQDGLVARWRERDLMRLRQDGRRTTLLYFDAGQLAEDVSELTRPQLERDFARRAGALATAPEAARARYLDGLRLDALLALRQAEARAAGDAPAVGPVLHRRVAVALSRLAESLPAPAAPGELTAREEAWLRDIDLVAGWAGAAGQATSAAWLAGWADVLRPEVATLAAMQPRP